MDSLGHPQHLRPPRILVISRAAFMPTTRGGQLCLIGSTVGRPLSLEFRENRAVKLWNSNNSNSIQASYHTMSSWKDLFWSGSLSLANWSKSKKTILPVPKDSKQDKPGSPWPGDNATFAFAILFEHAQSAGMLIQRSILVNIPNKISIRANHLHLLYDEVPSDSLEVKSPWFQDNWCVWRLDRDCHDERILPALDKWPKGQRGSDMIPARVIRVYSGLQDAFNL
jgi:hypothetical protein